MSARSLLTRLEALCRHRYVALAFRLYLGGLFIYASMYKINYPAEFAESIAMYRIVPYFLVPLLAVAMPWIELTAGFTLLAGIRPRSSAIIIGAMLAMFAAGILVNLLRGAPISCGCFHALDDKMTWQSFFRDLAWIGMAAHVFFFDTALHLENAFRLKPRAIE